MAFAEQVGIHPSQLWKWIRQARNGELPRPRSALVSVRVKPDRPKQPPAPIELVLSGGKILRVPGGFDADHLRRLIEAVEGC